MDPLLFMTIFMVWGIWVYCRGAIWVGPSQCGYGGSTAYFYIKNKTFISSLEVSVFFAFSPLVNRTSWTFLAPVVV